MRSIRITALSVLTAGAIGATATAGEGARPLESPRQGVHASPDERGQWARAFVLRWGTYVQATYAVDVHTWARRLVPHFARGDAVNLRRALSRSTFEGAMAEITGRGMRLSDHAAITRFARTPASAGTKPAGGVGIAMLGELDRDLVYTPLQPCRIVDTRNTVSGAIPSDGTRHFIAWGVDSFAPQGGAANDCGLATESPAGLALNVTVVGPIGAGYTTVYPFGQTRPFSASLNYTQGAVVNNGLIAKLGAVNSQYDFSIYTTSGADYVVDVVGYFDRPAATALDCIDATETQTVAAGQRGFSALACPAGFTATGGGARSAANDQQTLQASAPNQAAANEWFTSIRNDSSTAKDFTFFARCCRVPGK